MNSTNAHKNEAETESQEKSQKTLACRAYRSHFLYEIVTLTILILGICDFARNEHFWLLYIACVMVATYAGIPVITLLKELLPLSGLKK